MIGRCVCSWSMPCAACLPVRAAPASCCAGSGQQATTSQAASVPWLTLAASRAMPRRRDQLSIAATAGSLRPASRMLNMDPREHHSITSSGGLQEAGCVSGLTRPCIGSTGRQGAGPHLRQAPIQRTMFGCLMLAWIVTCAPQAAVSDAQQPAARSPGPSIRRAGGRVPWPAAGSPAVRCERREGEGGLSIRQRAAPPASAP